MSKVVVRHTLYNAAGLVTPILAALVAIPILIQTLGAERFGILTLVWAVVNYFGIFDLGLGRALTLQLAVLLSNGRDGEANEVIRTTLGALLILGVLAGGVLILSTPFFLARITVSTGQAEMIGTIIAMAFALPFVVVTSGVRGALEARSAFGWLNAIRIPMSIVNFALPVVIAVSGGGLNDISLGLAFARIIGLAMHTYPMTRMFPSTFSKWGISRQWLTTLLTNGGWMTVSNVVGPLMGYLDRFIVGFVMSAAFVAYYATPQELILKVFVIPGALTAVLFPAFARSPSGSRQLYQRSLLAMTVIILPACAVGIVTAHFALSLWVGEPFADQSYRAMQLLLLGVACGAISTIPYTYLQALGWSKLTALSHVIQLPTFLLASYVLTSRWGIEGAAVAWSVRAAVDAIILFVSVEVLPTSARLARL